MTSDQAGSVEPIEYVRLLDLQTGRPVTLPMVPGLFSRWWAQNQHLYRHLATVTEGNEMTLMVEPDFTLQPQK